MKNCGGCQDSGGETGGDGDIAVLRRLVGGDKNRYRLTNMDVDGGVCVLEGVSPLHLHQLHFVILDSNVE